MPSLATVVTGESELDALPLLIRRIAEELDPELYVDVPRPLRAQESKLIRRSGELERFTELAARRAAGGAVLILLDCDDGCPASLGPELLERAKKVRADVPIEVALAKREFESWFLASAESIRGLRGLAADLAAPEDPESIRDAKGWLGARGGYRPVIDQPALAAKFNLSLARQRSDSFASTERRIRRLLQILRRRGP